MADKIKLPHKIDMPDAIYTLVYIPSDENYVEPNYSIMQPAAADCTLVDFGGHKKWMSWAVMDAPARAGSATPPRRFLLFRLYDQPIKPIPAMFPDMIVYMCLPREQGKSPAQQFLDALVGKQAEEVKNAVPRDDWAQRLFAISAEEENNTVPDSQENHEESGHSSTKRHHHEQNPIHEGE